MATTGTRDARKRSRKERLKKRLVLKISSISLYIANDDPWHDAGAALGFVLHPPFCTTDFPLGDFPPHASLPEWCLHYFSAKGVDETTRSMQQNNKICEHQHEPCLFDRLYVRKDRTLCRREKLDQHLVRFRTPTRDFVSFYFVMTRIVKDREGNSVA